MRLFYFLSLLNLWGSCVSVSHDLGKVDLPTALFFCSFNVVVLLSPPLTKYFQWCLHNVVHVLACIILLWQCLTLQGLQGATPSKVSKVVVKPRVSCSPWCRAWALWHGPWKYTDWRLRRVPSVVHQYVWVYPAISRLIITFPLDPQFCLPLVRVCVGGTLGLIARSTILCDQRDGRQVRNN